MAGNPYHDEEGRFTSKTEMANAVVRLVQQGKLKEATVLAKELSDLENERVSNITSGIGNDGKPTLDTTKIADDAVVSYVNDRAEINAIVVETLNDTIKAQRIPESAGFDVSFDLQKYFIGAKEAVVGDLRKTVQRSTAKAIKEFINTAPIEVTPKEDDSDGPSIWFGGEFAGYKYEAKAYEQPSEYGIENGRVSKLWIKNPEVGAIAEYERGWGTRPKTAYEKAAMKRLVEHLEVVVPEYNDQFYRKALADTAHISLEKLNTFATPQAVKENAHRIYDWLQENGVGPDSVVREEFFYWASDKLSIPYDSFYNAWLINKKID